MNKSIQKGNFTHIIFLLHLTVAFVNVNAQDNVKWEILSGGINQTFSAIEFLNEDIGWIAGEGILSKTEDGGNTWNHLQPQLMGDWNPNRIDFINEDEKQGFLYSLY